jgi:hypothetical protein
MAYERWCKEINTIGVAGSISNVILSGINTYKAKITAHQRAATNIMQHLESTATLVGYSQVCLDAFLRLNSF